MNILTKQIKRDKSSIIQDYLDNIDVATISLIPLQRWINCNTREDFTMIRKGWRKI